MLYWLYVLDDDPLAIVAVLLLGTYTLLEFVPLSIFAMGSIPRHLLWSIKVTFVVLGTLLFVGSRIDASVRDVVRPYDIITDATTDPLIYAAAGIYALLSLAYILTWKKRIGEDAGDSVVGAVFAGTFYMKKMVLRPSVIRVLALIAFVFVGAVVL